MRLLLKIICVFVVVLVAVAASGYAWIARDRGPSHPTLAAAEMAPLIPLRDFWANQNSEWGYTLSPRGAYMSWWAVDGADTILKVRDRKSGAVQTIRPANDRAARYEWSYDDRHLLLSHYDADRWSVWRIDAADVASEWGEVTPRGFGNWISTYSPKSANDRRLLATYDRSREFHDLYAVDQDGLGKTLLRRNPGNVQWWRLDREGAVFLRAVNTGPGEFRIEYDPQRDDTGWQPLLSYTARDTVWVLTDDAHGNVIMLSDIGREQLALVRIDPNTRSETVMLEDPSRSIEAWYRFSPAAPAVDVVEFGGGYPEYVAMTPLGEAAMNALEALETPFNMNILSATDDGALVTLVLNEREDGWRYALVDTRNASMEWIGTHDLTRHSDAFAETTVHRIAARDGLEIPVLLTLPKGVDGPVPMVALIHGGPASHDDWFYNEEVQFLANRGYAVLRVNYRGSTGHGRSFRRAGDRQYGRAMQDDIQDAVQWAIDQGYADKDAVAIMGASFGGYAAMMGLVRDPGFYAAGISIVGALDLENQTVYAPHLWGIDKTGWIQVIGDPDIPEDRAEMRAHSPINFVDRITEPVLLVHGINDPVVDRAYTERFERRLRELGKPHEAHYYEKEGHGLQRWQSKVRFYRTLEDFLAQHLGGRSGGFDYVEIGAEYLYP